MMATFPNTNVVIENEKLEAEADRILDYERYHRANELVVASSSISSLHKHAVEDLNGGRFLALSGDSDSDNDPEIDEEIIVLDTPEFIKIAM